MNISNTQPKNRFHWIDRTKGLAILGIVLFHFFQNYPERELLIKVLDRNFARVGYAAVDIFFLMAGFNTSYSLMISSIKAGAEEIKNNWKSWLVKRLLRLYPSYWLAVICSCLLYYFFSRFEIKLNTRFIFSVLGLTGVHSQAFNPGFWFVSVIIQAYLLTPIIFIFSKNRPKQILWIGIILGILTKIIACYFLFEKTLFQNDTYNYLFFLQNNFIGSYISQYCLGLYWGLIYAENKDLRKEDVLVSTSVFILGLIIYFSFVILRINIIYMLGFDILFTPFFFIAIKTLFVQLEKIISLRWLLSFMSILGVYSYQIFLVHQPLYFVSLSRLTKTLNLNNFIKIWVILLIIMVLLTVYIFIFNRLEIYVNKLIKNINNFSNQKE